MSEVVDYDPVMAERVVTEAMTWMKTPWHHMARVKGGGVDCAQFLCAVFEAVGLTPHIDLGYYPIDWHMHQSKPRFLEELEKYAYKVDVPLKGDVAMFKFARQAAHGSIVVEWPRIIHAYSEARCVTLDEGDNGRLGVRLAGFYRIRTQG